MTSMTRRMMLASATAMTAAPLWAQSTTEDSSTEGAAEGISMRFSGDIVLGNPDAEVTVVEYASFTCPHCRRFHEGPYKQLEAEYIDTGKIKFVYREVFFDPQGLWAAMLARCAGQDRYMMIADMIYAQQSEWPVRDDPGRTAANLKKMGLVAGMDGETVDACFADRPFAKSLVATYQENATADNINSTPSFVINGRTYGNMNYAELSGIIDDALGS
ncbi:MAG: DsbA family protein [Pseudomonadota bacterium]